MITPQRLDADTEPDSNGGSDAGTDPGRDETENERHDRNWNDILQELRVIQTGTQILTGFLLTLPFQQRFGQLHGYEVGSYLALVVTAVIATILALSPVALHRTLFRRKAKGAMVVIANRLLKVTLAAIGLTLCGTAMLIFDVVVGLPAGIMAGVLALVLVLCFWVAFPLSVRRKHPGS